MSNANFAETAQQTIERLQERVKELEELSNRLGLVVKQLHKRINKVYDEPKSELYSLVLTKGEMARIKQRVIDAKWEASHE